MSLPVYLTDSAVSDLTAIGRYIAQYAPDRALRLVEELEQRCRGIGGMPLAYPLVPGHEEAGIRRRIHRDYLIFYRVDDDRVIVLHVLAGAMDVESILFPKE